MICFSLSMEVVVVVVLGICNRCALLVVLLHYFSQEYKADIHSYLHSVRL